MTAARSGLVAPRTDDELLALVPAALRGQPGGLEEAFWIGVLKGMGRVDAYFDTKANQLRRGAYDPDTAPSAVIPYLAASVGLSPDLPAVASLTPAELRRLAVVAVALWKRKGTDDSWRDILLRIGPARALILDWFALRTIEGSALAYVLLPDVGADGGSYSHPETVTDVWCEDRRHALDLGKIGRLLDLVRPANERINLYSALFVEDCRQGLAQWGTSVPLAAQYDADRLALRADTVAGSGERTGLIALPGEAPDLAGAVGYHLRARLAVIGSSGSLWVALGGGSDLDDGYEVRVAPGAPGDVRVYRWTAGTPVLVADSGSGFGALVEGYRYRWAVDVWRGATATEIQVRCESVLAVTATDSSGDRRFTGRWGFSSGTVDDDRALLDSLLVWRAGETPTRIGPS